MIKYRLVTGSVIIALLLSIVFGLYLYAITPPNKNVSKEIHIATLTSNDGIYYSNNVESIVYEDSLYTFWVEDGKITYSIIDAEGNSKGIFELNTQLNKSKKIKVIPNDNYFEIYVMEDTLLNKYTLDNNNQSIIDTDLIVEGIIDFSVSNESVVYIAESVLNVLNNDELVYSSESGVDSFISSSKDDNLHIVYKVKADGNSNITYITLDKNNSSQILYNSNNIELTTSSFEDVYVNDNGHIGIILQKDNRAKDTSFVNVLISNDGGNTFEKYSHATSFMNMDLKFGHIDSKEYSIYEIYKGNLYLNSFNESKLTRSSPLTNTTKYSTSINTGKIGDDLYYQWAEKSNEVKELYFGSTNKAVIAKSLELTKDDKVLILVDTLILLATMIIPMFILFIYFGIVIGVIIVILKVVLKDELDRKSKIVSRIIGGVYIVLVSSYLVFYLNKHFEVNIFSNYLNQWQFMIINLVIALLAYASTLLKTKHVKIHTHFEKVTHFMILEFIFLCLFTMPNILMSWFGNVLFY